MRTWPCKYRFSLVNWTKCRNYFHVHTKLINIFEFLLIFNTWLITDVVSLNFTASSKLILLFFICLQICQFTVLCELFLQLVLFDSMTDEKPSKMLYPVTFSVFFNRKISGQTQNNICLRKLLKYFLLLCKYAVFVSFRTITSPLLSFREGTND